MSAASEIERRLRRYQDCDPHSLASMLVEVEDSKATLRAEVARLTERNAELVAALEDITSEFERTVRHLDNDGTGMQVPFHGDFAGAKRLPSMKDYDALRAEVTRLTEDLAHVTAQKEMGGRLYEAICAQLEPFIPASTRELEWDVIPGTIGRLAKENARLETEAASREAEYSAGLVAAAETVRDLQVSHSQVVEMLQTELAALVAECDVLRTAIDTYISAIDTERAAHAATKELYDSWRKQALHLQQQHESCEVLLAALVNLEAKARAVYEQLAPPAGLQQIAVQGALAEAGLAARDAIARARGGK